VLVVKEEVGGCRRGDEAGRCEEVGDVVDVFVFGAGAAGEGGAEGRGGGFGALAGGFEAGF
jgi:hypothetical protein